MSDGTGCASCARHERAREASRQQLEALWAENERLAADLMRLQALVPAGKDIDVEPLSTLEENAAEHKVQPPATRPEPVCHPLPDLYSGGDGRLPRRIIARLPPVSKSKTLAASMLSLRTPQQLLVLTATADRQLALWQAGGDSCLNASAQSPLDSTLTSSPILSISEAVLVEVAGDRCLLGSACAIFLAGHVDGLVTLWAVMRDSSLSLRCLSTVTGVHSKFVTRALVSALTLTLRGRVLGLTTSSDGSAAVWAMEVANDSPQLPTLRRLQTLSFSGPLMAAAWRPPQSAAGAASSPAAFVVSVEAAPYLYYFDFEAGAGSSSGDGGGRSSTAQSSLLLRRVPLSEDGMEVSLDDDPAASSGVATASRLPLLHETTEEEAAPPRTGVPVHHPDSTAVHLPRSGELDVVPVGYSIVDVVASVQGRPGGARCLLASATSSGLVILSTWGGNRVLRRFAGHLTSISPTYVAPAASLVAASLRLAWLPQAAATGPPLYLVASMDAGDAMAVFSLASSRAVGTLDAAGDVAGAAAPRGSRTTLRSLMTAHVPAYGGPLILTLDNGSNVTVRALDDDYAASAASTDL